MTATNAYRANNVNVRTDGTTIQERIEETIDQRLALVEHYQGIMDAYEEERLIVPDYISQQYQNAVESLESYAGYWGMDC